MTEIQREALVILKRGVLEPERTLLAFFIENLCAVGCGEEEGCFYCGDNLQAVENYVRAGRTALETRLARGNDQS